MSVPIQRTYQELIRDLILDNDTPRIKLASILTCLENSQADRPTQEEVFEFLSSKNDADMPAFLKARRSANLGLAAAAAPLRLR